MQIDTKYRFDESFVCQTGATTVSFMTDPPFVTQRALQSLWCVNHHDLCSFIFILCFSPAVDAPSRNLIILCPIRWSQFTTLTSNTTKVIKETKSENSNNKQKKWKSDYPSWCTYSPALTKRDSVMWKNLKNHESAIITWCCFRFVNLKGKNDKMFLATHQDERRRRGQSPHG